MKSSLLLPGFAVVALCVSIPALSANFAIDNPAEKIVNPAAKMYNPASKIDNPAANIYNPAGQLDNPNPLSPVTQPVPKPVAAKETAVSPPVAQVKEQPKQKPLPAIPHKSYRFKTVGAYLNAAKKAFSRDDYEAFIAITEDAQRRIAAGTLRASPDMQQKLARYRVFGYGLLEKAEQ
jgi:hypothetical protein